MNTIPAKEALLGELQTYINRVSCAEKTLPQQQLLKKLFAVQAYIETANAAASRVTDEQDLTGH